MKLIFSSIQVSGDSFSFVPYTNEAGVTNLKRFRNYVVDLIYSINITFCSILSPVRLILRKELPEFAVK